MEITVIVPTRNRSRMLKECLLSIVNQDYDRGTYEILVIDNNSSDSTRKKVEETIAEYSSHLMRYRLEPEPGLLSCRHRGAFEARGKILAFIDDDICADRHWLKAIHEAFQDSSVKVVGGRILPKFQAHPPRWLEYCWRTHLYGRYMGELTLLDFGDRVREMDANFAWGGNFAICRETLFQLKGFHPDMFPPYLLRYRGDGETGLTKKAKAAGLKAVYAPGALVFHQIPRKRMTRKYFERRHFNQGISDSYAHVRESLPEALTDKSERPKTNNFKDMNSKNKIVNPLKKIVQDFNRFFQASETKDYLLQRFKEAYEAGYQFHQAAIKKDPALLKWVLRGNYLDYKIPGEVRSPGIMALFRKNRKVMNIRGASLYITPRCNSRCVTCRAWQNQSGESVRLPTEKWKAVIRELRNIGVESIDFSGGEPLLVEDLPEFVMEAKRNGFKSICLCTNAFLLDEYKIDQLESAGLTDVHLSIDGIGETHDKIRGMTGSFEKNLKVMEWLSLRKIRMLVCTNVLKTNIGEIPTLIELCNRFHAFWFPNLINNTQYNFKGIEKENLLPSDQTQVDHLLHDLSARVNRCEKNICLTHQSLPVVEAYLKGIIDFRNTKCVIGETQVYVAADGKVYSGCLALESVGSILKDSLDHIIRSRKYERQVARMREGNCPGCSCNYMLNVPILKSEKLCANV